MFDAEDLTSKNEYTEDISSIYNFATLDSRSINIIYAKCKDLGEGYSQFKNQDNSQKVMAIVKMINDFI